MAPTTRRCPHCGAELEPLLLPAPFGRGPQVIGWEQCQCDGARRERAELLAAEEEGRRREEAARRRRAYERAGIKPRFIGAEHPMAAGILDGVRAGRGAYVCGPVGTGKTHLASAVARMAVDGGMSVRVTDTLGILAALRGTYGSSGTEDGVLSGLSRCGLLVLDDLGKEPPTDWTLGQVFRIVNDRYETMRPVIVTTQFGKSDLIRRLAKNGDAETAVAIVSRLSEMCRKVELGGSDRRLADVR